MSASIHQHWTVVTVVEGTLEDEDRVFSQEELDDKIQEIALLSAQDGVPTQVWVLYHPHPPADRECACVQYLTDLSPHITFNMGIEA